MVTFRWRDSAHNNKKRLMTLSVNEFLRRFLLHVLPPGFVRIRHFGLMAHRRRGASLPLCLQLLAQSGRVSAEPGSVEKDASSPRPLWMVTRREKDDPGAGGLSKSEFRTRRLAPRTE